MDSQGYRAEGLKSSSKDMDSQVYRAEGLKSSSWVRIWVTVGGAVIIWSGSWLHQPRMEGGNLPGCEVTTQPGTFGPCPISVVHAVGYGSWGQWFHQHGHRLRGSFRKTPRKLRGENSSSWPSALLEVKNLCAPLRHPGTVWFAFQTKPESLGF